LFSLLKCDDTYDNSMDRARVEMPLRPGSAGLA